MTPTVCCPAPFLDDLDPRVNEPLALLEKMVPHMAFTEIWNATGQPAISLPLAVTAVEALPIGVQLVAAPGREDWLVSLAAELLPTTTGLPRHAAGPRLTHLVPCATDSLFVQVASVSPCASSLLG